MKNQNPETIEKLDQAFKAVLDGLHQMGYDVPGDDNFKGTSLRAAKGFAELVLPPEYIDKQIQEMLGKVFPTDDADGMVVSRNNFAVGLCPHHLLPVVMRITCAYVPKDKVLGISKLSRISKLLAHKPVLQETLSTQIARVLFEGLDSKGSAVMIHATHMCMALRGVESHETQVVTSKLYGIFKDQPQTRKEFYDICRAGMPQLF